MDVAKLISLIKKGNRQPACLYHFTDTRNIPSIAAHGLLSREEINRLKMQDVQYGGNQWSFDQDDRRGVSDFVHLSFFNSHPMEYLAKKDGRIEQSYFIKIIPEILDRKGVLFCAGVSNAANSILFDISEFDKHMDMEILFKRTDWRKPEIQERLKLAEKYEVLIPKKVPKTYLRK